MNEPSRSFCDLVVWQKAHALVLKVYQLSSYFPKEEVYGLTSQLRRAAVSVPANIAEGYRKASDADKVRYLNIAQGSLEEVRYYLILAADLNYPDEPKIAHELDEVAKLLSSYMAAIRRRHNS